MGKRHVYHVVPSSSGDWKVKKEGSDRATGVFNTQKAAIERARELAKDQQPSQVKIHGEDNKIREEHTYKKDPYPPKG
jgi:uncharacterized Fe-S cluster-containing radical SAM superfamily protein